MNKYSLEYGVVILFACSHDSMICTLPNFFSRLFTLSMLPSVPHIYTYTLSLQAVDAEYAEADARLGSSQEVEFEGEKITLDIPKEGIVLESGWTIIPHTLPEVSLFYNTLSVCYCRCSN